MKYYRNIDVVHEFFVNEATVRKWIRDTKAGRLNLALYDQDGRSYIANTPENIAIMQELAETRRKFRNTKAGDLDLPKNRFFGTWRSIHYKIAEGPNAPRTEYLVTLHLKSDQLIVESLPDQQGAYLFAKFLLEGNIATGTYQSQNAPHTRAKGAVYYGSAQLILEENGKAFHGMGVGFDKDMKASATAWSIVLVED